MYKEEKAGWKNVNIIIITLFILYSILQIPIKNMISL